MNILYVSITGTTGNLGGAEMCLLDVMASLRESRPDWSLSLITGEDGVLRQQAEALGVTCRVMPLPWAVARMGDSGLTDRSGKRQRRLTLAASAAQAVLPMLLYVRGLRKLVRSMAPDCMHTNSMKSHVLGTLSAPRRLPMFWHLHDFLGSRPVMVRLLKRLARPKLTGVAVSHAIAEDVGGVLGDKIKIVTEYNAVNLREFSPEGPAVDLDEASGLPPAPEGVTRVGLIATFASWKGHDVFIDAAAKLDASLAAKARFYIIGGPIYKSGGSQWSIEDLQERAKALGLGDRFGFAGFQRDPAAAIRGLDVVVHASTRPEPFGRVIVEGMACGKAVIAVKGGGSAELFEDGVSALGIPAGDPDALAAAMSKFVADPHFRAEVAAQGRASVIERFDSRHLAEKWLRIYNEGTAKR